MRFGNLSPCAAARLPSGLASSSAQLSQNARKLDTQIDVLQQWLSLEANTSWLLVLDSVDREWQAAQKDLDPQAFNVKDFLPSADHGNVLITTRVARLQRPRASLRLREVGNDLRREMLDTRAGSKLPGACGEKRADYMEAIVCAGAGHQVRGDEAARSMGISNETAWSAVLAAAGPQHSMRLLVAWLPSTRHPAGMGTPPQ
ncbi:hypothetical protein LTR22_024649 [Elasticomyces elasticus]|nr:hypothetical protein LTR22_024649 [Elasticomyces elasticus]KAK4906145.1 hypothetical protein LTR49_024659 [Elasticomyces elasticus]